MNNENDVIQHIIYLNTFADPSSIQHRYKCQISNVILNVIPSPRVTWSYPSLLAKGCLMVKCFIIWGMKPGRLFNKGTICCERKIRISKFFDLTN